MKGSTKVNLVIGDPRHNFAKLYVDIMLRKCDVETSSVVFISLSAESIETQTIYGVPVIHHSCADESLLRDCHTVTAISLNESNAFFLKRLIRDYGSSRKVFIHLTDDEVARWVALKERAGVFKSNQKAKINDDCLYVLKAVENVIAPKSYFEGKLKYLLPDKRFNFIDARDPFKSMPSEEWEHFEKIHSSSHMPVVEKSILIGAKRGVFNFSEVISLVKALKKDGLLPEYKLVLFTYKKKKYLRVLLDFYFGYLRHIKKCNVDVAYPIATTSIAYNAIVMSCSHLILQGRGSMSTARSYLSLGDGVICVKRGSANHIELKDAEGMSVIPYSNFSELSKFIKAKDVDVSANKKRIDDRFSEKYKIMKDVYCIN